jgi:hypothetical protein
MVQFTSFPEVWNSYLQAGLALIPVQLDTKAPNQQALNDALPEDYPIDTEKNRRHKPFNQWEFSDKEWRKRAFDKLVQRNEQFNYGIVGGKASGNTLVIDIDHLYGPTFARPELRVLFQSAAIVKTGKEGGQGRHLWVRCSDKIDFDNYKWYYNGQLGGEVCGVRNILVPPSIHPVTGATYQLISGDFNDLPVYSLEQIKTWFPEKTRPSRPTFKIPPPRPSETREFRPIYDSIRWADLFAAEGMLRGWHGSKAHVECPNASQHSEDKRHGMDTSTSILVQPDGVHVFKCLHSHCEHIDRDWLMERFKYRLPAFSEEFVPMEQSKPTQFKPIAPPKAPQKRETGLPDPKLFQLYGLAGEWQKHICDTARYRQEVLAAGAVLAAAGSIMGRRVVTEDATAMGSNVYCIGAASTASGKDHIITCVETAFTAIDLHRKITGSDFTSDAALEKILLTYPSALMLIDECAEVLQGMLQPMQYNQQQAIAARIGRMLLSLYTSSRPTKNWLGKEYARNRGGADGHDERIEIWMPCVSLFGLTVPNSLYKVITPDLVEGGMLNRLLLFMSENPNVTSNHSPSREPLPQKVLDKLASIGNWIPNNGAAREYEAKVTPHIVRYSSEAQKVWKEMSDESDQIRINPNMPYHELNLRMVENAKKVSLITSTLNGEQEITGECANAARILVGESVRVLKWNLLNRTGENSEFSKNLNKTLQFIRAQGEEGASATEFARALRGIKKRERYEILDQLVESGQVEQVEYQREGEQSKQVWRMSKEEE